MSDRDWALLEEIVDFSNRAIRIMAGRDLSAFAADETSVLAIRYCIQVIGEASNGLSASTKDSLPHIPWRQIVAMRHHLVHGYMSIDEQVVHETVALDLPQLVAVIGAHLSTEG